MIAETNSKPKLLVVGLGAESALLPELPVWMIRARTGLEAIQFLRGHRLVDVMASRWDLLDMPDGRLIRLVRAARPNIRSVVVLGDPSREREVMVRNLRVAAVLPADVLPEQLRDVVAQVLGVAVPVTASRPAAIVPEMARSADVSIVSPETMTPIDLAVRGG